MRCSVVLLLAVVLGSIFDAATKMASASWHRACADFVVRLRPIGAD